MFPRSYKPKTIPFQLLKQELVVDIKEKAKAGAKGKDRKAPTANPMMAELMKQKEDQDNDDDKEEEITTSIEALETEVTKKF